MQAKLPRLSQQIAVAAQQSLSLVDVLFDEVGVHLQVKHHLVLAQAEQALFQFLFQFRVVAFMFRIPRDAVGQQGFFFLRRLCHRGSSSLCIFASTDFQYMQRE